MRLTTCPYDEPARLAALYRCAVLDTQREQAFDDLVSLAACAREAPITVIGFIDRGAAYGD